MVIVLECAFNYSLFVDALRLITMDITFLMGTKVQKKVLRS